MSIIKGLSARFRKKNKTAIILAGGGLVGWMYEIGALAAIDDFFEDGFSVNDFDIYVGTSAGASVASLLANGVSPFHVLDAIIEDKPSVYNFKRKDIYTFGWSECFISLKKTIKSILPMAQYYIKNRSKFSLMDAMYIFQENFPSGIFTLNNLEKYLESNFSAHGVTNDFRELNNELYIPAIDLDAGYYHIFGEEGNDDVPISKAVAASSAIPIIFQPVNIKGKDYVDGSVGKVAHINVAINHGADFIIIINPIIPIHNDRENVCISSFHGKCVGLREKGLSFIVDQVLRVNTETKLKLGVSKYQAEFPEKDIFMIQPNKNEIFMFNYNIMSFYARLEVLNYGYFSTVRMLMKNYDHFKNSTGKYGIKVSLDKFREEEQRWYTCSEEYRKYVRKTK